MAWDPANEEERPWMTNAVSEKRFPIHATLNGGGNQNNSNIPADAVWNIDSNGELYGWHGGQPIENQQNSPFNVRYAQSPKVA